MSSSNRKVALVLGILVAGCSTSDDAVPENTKEALATYASIAFASYLDSHTAAQELDQAVDALVAAPTAERLALARDAWLAAREPYLQTEVFRFYDGPIDNPQDGPEGLVNAWPLDEAYIDYVVGNPGAGIVNNAALSLAAGSLEELNEQGGEENVATGYHAIEFLLWGQDLNDDGPGARPHTDFVVGGTAQNQERRGAYLQTVSGMLVGHLDGLVDAWDPAVADNYLRDWLTASPSEGLRRALTGMIVLSGFETGGERLQAALDTGDQEDEHSCFSDNTHRDMIQDIQGVQNVWLGRYQSLTGDAVEGTGLREVVYVQDPALAEALDEKIADSLRLANTLGTPFDQEIALGNEPGRARVRALVTSLREQERLLQDVFRAFALSIPEPE